MLSKAAGCCKGRSQESPSRYTVSRTLSSFNFRKVAEELQALHQPPRDFQWQDKCVIDIEYHWNISQCSNTYRIYHWNISECSPLSRRGADIHHWDERGKDEKGKVGLEGKQCSTGEASTGETGNTLSGRIPTTYFIW